MLQIEFCTNNKYYATRTIPFKPNGNQINPSRDHPYERRFELQTSFFFF